MNKIVIEKKELLSNISIIKKMADKTKIIAVVKYNGYGLGLLEYAKILMDEGINFFAVASCDEALKLREAYQSAEILNMSSTCIKEEIDLMIKNNIIVTIGSKECFEVLKQIVKNENVRAHIKVDTGLGRYGFLPNEIDTIKEVLQYKNIDVEGIFSHFSISFYDEGYTKKQFDIFNSLVNELENSGFRFNTKHICNSSAFLLYKNMHLDAVRIGSAFLGRLSIPNKYGLKSVGYLESEVSDIKFLPKNHNIGYSNTYKTARETKVAIVSAGTIDGINLIEERNKNRAIDKMYYLYNDIKKDLKGYHYYAKIGNNNYKVIGGVDLSHMILDITGSSVKVGDKVVFDINTFYANPLLKREYK